MIPPTDNLPPVFLGLASIIRGRRSIRRYLRSSVSSQVIDQILDLARWAPSAHNRQPWRFAVITQDMHKQCLAREMGEALRRDLEADSMPVDRITADVERSHERVVSAPTILVVCLSMRDMDCYPDAKRNHNEYLMAVQSVAMAGQNLLLAAHAVGLGACWLCAPLFCPEVVRSTLGLPVDWEPQGLITLGYPAEHRTKDRQSTDTRIVWL